MTLSLRILFGGVGQKLRNVIFDAEARLLAQPGFSASKISRYW
jgi:hypothetical protein